MQSPFIYHEGTLAVKVKYLVTDKDKRHKDSMKFISYKALNSRLNSDNFTEKQLRKGSFAGCALVQFSSLSRDWKDRLTTVFGNPKEEVKKSWFAQHYFADREAFDFYLGHRYGENNDQKLDLDKVELYTIGRAHV